MISPFVSNCLPRNKKEGVILWPFTKNDLWIGFIPIYASVKIKNQGSEFVSPPHCAVPRYSYVTQGKRVLKYVKSDTKHDDILSLFRILTATTYSGALILKHFTKKKH